MVETEISSKELKRIQSLEAEVNFLNQQLQNKDKQLEETQIQLEKQEKIAALGMLSAEIFHDLKNIVSFIFSSKKACLSRLESIEKSFEEASFWLEKETIDDFFGEVLVDLIPKSKNSLQNIEDKTNRIVELTKRVGSHLDSNDRKDRLIQDLETPEISKDKLVFTDINNLVNTCLEEAVEVGQNKKISKGEKKLNLDLNIDFDSSIGEVKINQEHFRRILINLIDNAFYTVYEKYKKLGDSYRPTISVKTEKLAEESMIITVEDNGEGIEMGFWKAVKPLVSTKPEGEGTGLGLSIVEKLCKESNIEINGQTEPGNFTRFTLKLLSQS